MHFLVVCDKFKSSLTAPQVCNVIAKSLLLKYPEVSIEKRPFADGGDGTLDVIKTIYNTEEFCLNTQDPLGRTIESNFLISENTAFIELAAASGIARIKDHELNPMLTHTIGTGKLIEAALETGLSEIVLCLGGSCTNDAGLGIAHALGFRFKDRDSNELDPIGMNLTAVQKIYIPDNLKKFNLKILCDVSNPLYGANGAAHVFGRQKGANDEQIKILDLGLQHIAYIIKEQMGVDIAHIEGGAAAGGIAAGLFGLLEAEVLNGFDYLSELCDLEEAIEKAEVIITGEGRLDHQSLDGKLVGKIASLAKSKSKKLVAVVGQNTLSESVLHAHGIEAVYAVDSLSLNLQDAMERAAIYVEKLAMEI